MSENGPEICPQINVSRGADLRCSNRSPNAVDIFISQNGNKSNKIEEQHFEQTYRYSKFILF